MKLLMLTLITFMFMNLTAQSRFESDTIATKQAAVIITFIGHGTLMLTYNNLTIHIDPVSSMADYKTLPKADIIIVTHEHGDHLDSAAIDLLSKDNTVLIFTSRCNESIKNPRGTIMINGDRNSLNGIGIEAVPAYNIQNKRPNGQPFHAPGEGNGYILSMGGLRIYIAGDTENTPEMKALKNIDIAFLPMNLPYTMTPEMVADAALAFKPGILYPYHFGKTDTNNLIALLKDSGIDVRIRNMR
jgi:L-ascorbate metabolism protein UlaG (beta-lactamase superfamily)